MKKYENSHLEEAISQLHNIEGKGTVLRDFLRQLELELKKQKQGVFVKATDSYIKTLKREDRYIRLLNDQDPGYYPGMYGCFEKKTNKLLRRHTDLGMLPSGILKT